MCHSPQEPVSVSGALVMLGHALTVLAAADAGSLPVVVQAQALRMLEQAQARHTVARANILAAFTAQDGYVGDGQGNARTWLRWQTRVTKSAAAATTAWVRRLGAHPVIGQALAAGEISASWARELCQWTDRLPEDKRDDGDTILIAAARGCADLADLAGPAEDMYQRSYQDSPGDGFDDRGLWLGVTLGGAGRLTGDLSAGCAAALSAVLDSLAKKAGPEDDRSAAQRRHDGLEEACRRLIAAGLLPARAGQPTQAQVHITLAQLRDMPGASQAEAAWRTAAASQHGWLTGPDADAAACDATIAPIVTGHVDPAALDTLVEMFLNGQGLAGARGTQPCACGACPARTPLPAGTLARLRGSLLAMAADVLSGPGRARLLAAALTAHRRPCRDPQPAPRRPTSPRRRAGRTGHPRPLAPRGHHPPPPLRVSRLRPPRQRLPGPPSDPPRLGRANRPSQPCALVRLSSPDSHPPLGLDPDPAPQRHHDRHQPQRPHPPQPRTTRERRLSAAGSRAGVDPFRGYQDRGAAFFRHDPVVGVPVVVCAPGGSEDLPQQNADAFSVQPEQSVVRARQISRAFHRRPIPAGPDHHGHTRTRPQVRELVALASGHESGDRQPGDRVVEHSPVHHG
jgi:hypothetical protein